MEERLAALWENSAAARNELREHAPLVRRAVGLGRAALDPLSLLAALCGPDKEVRFGVAVGGRVLGRENRRQRGKGQVSARPAGGKRGK